jgi:hypothetical protein
MNHLRSVSRKPEHAIDNAAQVVITFVGQVLTASVPLFSLKKTQDLTTTGTGTTTTGTTTTTTT